MAWPTLSIWTNRLRATLSFLMAKNRRGGMFDIGMGTSWLCPSKVYTCHAVAESARRSFSAHSLLTAVLQAKSGRRPVRVAFLLQVKRAIGQRSRKFEDDSKFLRSPSLTLRTSVREKTLHHSNAPSLAPAFRGRGRERLNFTRSPSVQSPKRERIPYF